MFISSESLVVSLTYGILALLPRKGLKKLVTVAIYGNYRSRRKLTSFSPAYTYSLCAAYSTFHVRDLPSQKLNKYYRCCNCQTDSVKRLKQAGGDNQREPWGHWGTEVLKSTQSDSCHSNPLTCGHEPVWPSLTSPETQHFLS